MNSSPPEPSSRVPDWLVAVVLALVTLAVFWPATHCGFLNCDDDVYVTTNARLQQGLTLDNIAWYFTNPYFSNWHPLTMVSYLVDYECFGLNPAGYHLTNILFHALNTALVFLVLRRLMEGVQSPKSKVQGLEEEVQGPKSEARTFWGCVMVAALFGLHPLHVESVAWVAERKDVLSGFFFLLTLWAYARFAQRSAGDGRWKLEDGENRTPHSAFRNGSRGYHYWLAVGLFAAGLMCKPMLVTLPCVLLLLDFWPLGRMNKGEDTSSWNPNRGKLTPHPGPLPIGSAGSADAERENHSPRQDDAIRRLFQVLKPLLVEKLPFFGLALASSIVTYLVQEQGGAVLSAQAFPWDVRIGNALISYGRYLGKTFWPVDLAVFYPHPGQWPMEQVLLAVALLGGISWLAWSLRQRQPYLLVGWLWFVGMLVPVIGLVQAGEQAMADRYAYLPLLGVFIALVWGTHDLMGTWRQRTTILAAAGAAVVVLCGAATWRQLGYWKNSETIFRHAVAVTKDNPFAHNDLGIAVMNRGDFDEAIQHFKEAARLSPTAAEIRSNLGMAYLNKGSLDEAVEQLQEAILCKPWYAPAHANLAMSFFKQGDMDGAIREFQATLRLKPDFTEARMNLGVVLLQKGEAGMAAEYFQDVLRVRPDDSNTHFNLGLARFNQGRLDEAVDQFQAAARLNPKDGESQARFKLTSELKRGINLSSADPAALNNIAWELATSPNAAVRCGPLAVQLGERACALTRRQVTVMLGTLAAAYAEAGRFDEAAATAQQAIALAQERGETELQKRNAELLKLYQAHQPYHEAPARQP